MLSSNRGIRVGWLAGRFPGRVGHLFSPGDQRGPFDFMPYALDNGAFSAWVHKRPWNINAWVDLMDWAAGAECAPTWVLVPDVVTDARATVSRWNDYAPFAAMYGWPLAFAVQDGMVVADVPLDAAVVFVGGSTQWKWETVPYWAAHFPRVHVGRVNSPARLYQCAALGVESVDGTGWCINPKGEQFTGLVNWYEHSHNQPTGHMSR